jgi:hypothetical protein
MKGWRYQSYRHSLAARGVRTSLRAKHTQLNGSLVAKTKHGIPITMKDKPDCDNKYPVSVNEVKEVFDEKPYDEVVGITEINFRKPGIPATKQDKAWAQYVRSKKRVNVFTQKFDNKKKQFEDVDLGTENPENARMHMIDYVLPHEVAHHTLQHVWKKDKDPMIVEEARADAMAAGMNPLDKNVEKVFIKSRKDQFGPKGSI